MEMKQRIIRIQIHYKNLQHMETEGFMLFLLYFLNSHNIYSLHYKYGKKLDKECLCRFFENHDEITVNMLHLS